jgi:hypothetical protein
MAIDVGSIDASLSTGNVSYTPVGFLPTAIIFWGNLRTTAGATDNAEAGYFQGMTDGVTSGVVAYSAGENVSPGTNHFSRQAVPVHMVDRSGTVLFSAELVSLDNDGFTLNWTVAAGSGYDIHYMAIGGVDIDAVHVGSLLITATGAVAETGLGFTPDGLIGICSQTVSAVPDSGGRDLYYGIGLTDGTTHGSIGGRRGTGFTTVETRTTDEHWLIAGRGTGDRLRVTLDSFDVDGFTYDPTLVTNNSEVLYLAIKADNLKVGTLRTPSGTGTVAETGVGFLPEGVLGIFIPSSWDGGATRTTGITVGSALAMGAADGSNQVGNYVGYRDASTKRFSGFSNSLTNIVEHPDAAAHEDKPGANNTVKFSVDSLDADGFTLDHTVVTERGGFFYMALIGGATADTFDNKLIYADGISSV